MKTVCILGRQPALGLAELESVYGAEHVKPFGNNALLDIEAAEVNFRRLGGTIKVARVLNTEVGKNWSDVETYLQKNSPGHIDRMPEMKITVGISAYGIKVSPAKINATGLSVKKIIRKSGRPGRIVPNKESALSSAQVLHNKLTSKGGWELIFASDGQKIILAQTFFVQDIEAYGARDQARPARDARVGMLPPKLAQIIINLATSEKIKDIEDKTRIRILDPFCGTGVVLQEALLAGYSVVGTDIEPRMVEYSQRNLKWLFEQQPSLEGSVVLEQGDATNYQWAGFTAVASEVFLGRPLNNLPGPMELKQIISDANTITKKFLKNISGQLKPGQQLCLALPAWIKKDGSVINLSVIDQLTDMGYNYLDLKHVRREELVYFREGQVVARRLIRIRKV